MNPKGNGFKKRLNRKQIDSADIIVVQSSPEVEESTKFNANIIPALNAKNNLSQILNQTTSS